MVSADLDEGSAIKKSAKKKKKKSKKKIATLTGSALEENEQQERLSQSMMVEKDASSGFKTNLNDSTLSESTGSERTNTITEGEGEISDNISDYSSGSDSSATSSDASNLWLEACLPHSAYISCFSSRKLASAL